MSIRHYVLGYSQASLRTEAGKRGGAAYPRTKSVPATRKRRTQAKGPPRGEAL
jgi:hypothetical protein